MRKFYVVVFFSLLSMNVYSQAVPGIEWESCIMNGAFKSISKVTDSTFVIAGIAYGCDIPTTINMRVVNSDGEIKWTKNYFFGNEYDDNVYSVVHTIDGGFIFSGYENRPDGSSYNLIVKTNSTGDTLWTKRFFSGMYTTPASNKIINTADGGYCFAGSAYSFNLWDVKVIKLDASGNLVWNKTFGGSSDDYGKDLLETDDGSFVISATTASNDIDVSGNHGGNDVWILKINASGNIVWKYCYGGTGNDEGKSIIPISGQRFGVLSISGSDDGQVIGHHGTNSYFDYWLMKISSGGSLLWNNSYGGSAFDVASQLLTSSDGRFLMGGSSYSNDGDISSHHGTTDFDDMWVVCTDSLGDILWDKSCGGTNSDRGNALGKLNNSQWIIAGSSLSDDGDHNEDCVNNDCYPISGQWMVKLNESCEAFPEADFTFTQTDNTIHFTNTSTDATNYSWDFGDNKTGTAVSPNHNYNKNGLFNACLTAYYNSCASSTECKIVATCIDLTPDFNFTFSGLTVSFEDQTPMAAKWLWNFGDGSTDTLENSVHTYTDHASFQVTLTTWDSCGNSYHIDKSVNTCDGLASNFTYTTTGNTYYFSDASFGKPNSWFWDFGDGGTSTQKNPVHTFTTLGNDSIPVCLTIDHTQCGTPDTKCQALAACMPAVSAFTDSIYDYQVFFENGSENATSYLWDFGDGTTSLELNPVHVYPNVISTYNVKMIAKSECGNDTSEKIILVGKNPVMANFTYVTLSLSVAFTNLSTNAVSYHWDFGDGSTSTATNPFHSYSANGIYEVCLIATDQFSLSDTMCQIIYLCGSFTGNYTVTTSGLTATFTDASAGATEWNWSFGDGGSSIVQNPIHTFPANGTYNVCMIASNVCGYADTVCQTITVCAPIVPDYSYSDTYLSVQFTDLTGTATSWLWIFGDGNTSMLQNPVHNYSSASTNDVCLIAFDLCGNTGTKCKSVTVCTPITANFTDSVINLQVNFKDQTSSAVNWNWDFGDGFTSTLKNPSHIYLSDGIYEVCLTVTDVCGNQDSVCKSIQVCQPIIADYSFSPSYLTVSFNDLTLNATGWVWYFDDGQTAFTQNPTHTYANPGTYNVCLIASNICNISDNICETVTVCAPITAAFSTSSFYLTASFTNQTVGAVQWQWDFGDGNNSSSQNPNHTYTSNGTYEVCLVATDICGSKDTVCQSITLCGPLSANFGYSATYLTASFTDMTSTATAWQWNFGDGGSSSSQNPNHSYTANGTYEVCLTATDLCGHADTTCETITVCGALNTDFSNTTSTDLSATFSDLSAGAVQWFWDFGDGSISTSQNPTHTYASSGDYNVCLIAFNECTSDTMCKVVTIDCPPFDAAFTFEASNFNVSFNDASDNSIQWYWDFGDGSTSSQADPIHVYAATGFYTVCLIASDGCSSDTICQTVQVIISSTGSVNADDLSLIVYPNPFMTTATIQFTLPNAAFIRFDLFDLQGKDLFFIPDQYFPIGINYVDLPDLKLAGGVYFLQMTGEDGKVIRKLIVE